MHRSCFTEEPGFPVFEWAGEGVEVEGAGAPGSGERIPDEAGNAKLGDGEGLAAFENLLKRKEIQLRSNCDQFRWV